MSSCQCRVSCTIRPPPSSTAACRLDLVAHRPLDRAQRVDVLGLGAGAERCGRATRRSERLTSQRSEPCSMRTSRDARAPRAASRSSATYARATSGASAPVPVDRLGDDLDQRDAGPVVVDEGVVGAVDAAGGAARRGWTCRCPPPCARARSRPGTCAARRRWAPRRRASRRRRSARRTARSGSSSACPGRSSSSARTGTTARSRSSSASPIRIADSTADGVDHRQRAGQPEAGRADLGVRLGAERRSGSRRTSWSRCSARRAPRARAPGRTGRPASSKSTSDTSCTAVIGPPRPAPGRASSSGPPQRSSSAASSAAPTR